MRLNTNFFNLSSLGEISWDDIKEVLKTKTFWGGVFGIFGVILGLLVLMHFLIMPWYTLQGRSVQVPSVVNLPAEKAITALEDAGFIVEKREQYHNPAFPVGVVAEQRPLGNAWVKPGRHVILFINSESRRFVEVPNVVMLLDEQAGFRLKEMGLQIGQVINDSTSQMTKGTIIRQDPLPRASVKTGTPINIWISVNYKTPPLPDLSGKTLDEAQRILAKFKLRLSVAYNDGQTKLITSSSPGPGSRLRIGDVVRVFLGSPPVEEPEEDETTAPRTGKSRDRDVEVEEEEPAPPPPPTDDGKKQSGDGGNVPRQVPFRR